MANFPISTDGALRKYNLPIGLLLIAAGLVGNYFKYPIFLNIDFLFGSIFTMLALQYFGLWRGIISAVLISSVTYFIWGHPYAILIMTAEVAVVGTLINRYKIALVLADALYWLVLGMPLIYIFYHGVMGVPLSNMNIVIIKQAVNGVANGLLARIIFTSITAMRRSSLTPYRELIYNLLILFTLCPTLLLLALTSRNDFASTENTIRSNLRQNILQTGQRLNVWIGNRVSTLDYLATMAAAQTPQQMQPHLEQARASDINLQRIALLDKVGITTAFSPLIDELGQSNLGRNFADRPYIPILKQTLKPMLTEVMMSKTGIHAPIVSLIAPVVIQGQYSGYVSGVLALDQIQESLQINSEENGLRYTLLDKNDNIILSNRKDQKMMAHFERGQGETIRFNDRISQWVPQPAPNSPVSERWASSFYVAETPVSNLAEWKLILEQPVAPFQKMMNQRYADALTLLFVMLIAALALAEWLSRRITATTEQLSELTQGLPVRLESGMPTAWPESSVLEEDRLIGNFRAMAETLAGQFRVNQELNASLEERVKAAMRDVRQGEELYRTLIMAMEEGVVLQDENSAIIAFNKSAERILGLTADQLSGKTSYDTDWYAIHEDGSPFPGETHPVVVTLKTGLPQSDVVMGIHKPDGALTWILVNVQPLFKEGRITPYRVVATMHDITERRQQEEKIHQLLAENETILGNAVVGIVYLKQRRIVSCNRRFEEMFQYEPGELTGKSSELLYDSRETFEHIGDAAYKTTEGNSGYTGDVKLRHKDGSLFWGTLSGKPLDPAHPHEGSVWVYSDITERKKAEADLRIAATAFESQESMVITDADGVILRVNQAFTETTGYTAEEAVGQTPRLLRSDRHDKAFYAAMWESLYRNGHWQGEIWDKRKNGELYPKWLTITAVKGSDGIVTHYVGAHIDITERLEAQERIQSLAFYDPLTGLPNRQLLLDRLQHALASSAHSRREGAILFIDLDYFKTVNDTLGHAMGDLLLHQVAQRLTACLREGDTVARLGGDEFVVVLEDLSKQDLGAVAQTEATSDKILAVLREPYWLDTQEYHGTASIGMTLFGNHEQGTEELLKQADIAMYQAKKAGRNTSRFFDPQMQQVIDTRATLESELREAILQQQFQLYYQIQVDDWRRPIGAEALIRWLHPERGLLLPLQFIPLTEETGLILPIGLWVLETACAQLKAWKRDESTQELVLSVNISARQFRQADFVAQIESLVQRHGINPDRLKLELTESMLLDNIEDTIITMKAIRKMGIRFSLDDFGTGYSSLQYLKQLPLSQLKIDQFFVRDLVTDFGDREIVSTIIAMAHSLNLDTIAEGVVTEEQHQILKSSGCAYYQGYLFGQPMSIEQFEALLKEV